MPLGVERDDLQLERLALVNDVAGVGDALMGQLADMDQALEPVADADEGAEVDELRDRAVDDVADLEVGHRRVPRVRLEAPGVITEWFPWARAGVDGIGVLAEAAGLKVVMNRCPKIELFRPFWKPRLNPEI